MGIANKEVICSVLMERAETDGDIVVLCSDSRGSASMTPFFKRFPEQAVETGIAEQNIVSIAAGMARLGKKAFVASPASFLSTRSMEQAKVDVAYSETNVKLIGISGGVSYGALGMTHHSANDIAALAAIPGMRVYIPSDRILTRVLMEHLVMDGLPAYIRVGRNAVEDVYSQDIPGFEMDKAVFLREGSDVAIIAAGELVKAATEAADLLENEGVSAAVLDMYCIKPLDEEAVRRAAGGVKAVITIEEHSRICGMGSMVAQIVAGHCPKRVVNLGLPDEPVIAGKSAEVFEYYGLTAENIVKTAKNLLEGI